MSSDFDRYARSYEREVDHAIAFCGQDHDVFVEAKAQLLLELAEQHVGPLGELRALDVGCGLGLVHPHLRPLGRVEGIDVASEVIEQAARRNPEIRYQTFDGRIAPYADGEFDVAFAICVLHHVRPEEWPGFVGELARVTRPGGLVAVFEHNPLNPLTRLVVYRCAFDDDVVLLRSGRLESLLAAQSIEEPRTRYLLFTPWARLRRFERPLRSVPFGAQYVTYGIRA